MDSGRVLRAVSLPRHLFGEGLARVGRRLLQLTWQRGTLLEYTDVSTFHRADVVNFSAGVQKRDTGLRDGWGITFDEAKNELLITDASTLMRWCASARHNAPGNTACEFCATS